MTLELRPARDPRKAYGFVGVVISLKDLSASVWLWYKDGDAGRRRRARWQRGEWKVKKVIEIPAEPADPADLPPLLQGFKAVPPLITDINLSLDDRQLYVSCWGTGELRQYDVSDPFDPKLTATTQIGGIVRRAAHPANPGKRLNGGPQMVELSRDGRRVYLTNGLYSPWDDAVLSRGPGELDGEARHQARGRHGARPQVLPGDGARRSLPPGAAPGRRRVVRLVLLLLMSDDARMSPGSATLLALGAGHGINPAMGWLFAVALGLQRGSRRAVWSALGPLAIGHARGDAGDDRCRGCARSVCCHRRRSSGEWRRCWSALGVYRLVRSRHIVYGGMRVNSRRAGDLVVPHGDGAWRRTHGAAAGAGSACRSAEHVHHLSAGMLGGGIEWSGITAAVVHTAGYLLVTGTIAAIVYEKVGLRFLRTAWVNLDLLWAVALVATGLATAL